MMKKQITQAELVMEYFKKNPNRNIAHPEIVDWLTKEWEKRTGSVFRDPDRAIRKLHQEGLLIKVKKGVYKFIPESASRRHLEDFDQKLKNDILKRDRNRCVICGKGQLDGVELHVDHIKPKDKGGEATLENGQTLCSQCNFRKKNYKQTETGKRMFIRLYELSKSIGDIQTKEFCESVLNVFEKYGINGHIEWEK